MNIISFERCVELKQTRIKCSAIHNGRLYLGCGDGTLYVYDVTEEQLDNVEGGIEDVKGGDIKLYKTCKMTEYSIDDVGVLPDMGYLVLISNGLVHVFRLADLQLEEKLSNYKNANLFKLYSSINENTEGSFSGSIDESYLEKNSLIDYSDSMSLVTLNSTSDLLNHNEQDPVQDYRSYIAICCKRKLTVYTFIKDEFSSKLEYNLNDKVKALEFLSSEKLLVALNNNDLNLIDLYKSDPQSLVFKITSLPYFANSVVSSTSSFGYFRNHSAKLFILRTLPNINLISKENILLKINKNGEFLNYKKKSSKKNPLHWAKPPTCIKYWFPYLVLVHDNNIEIRRIKTGHVLQTINLGKNMISMEHHGDLMFAITDHSIEILSRTSFLDQLEQAKNLHKYDDAISLIEKLKPLIFHTDRDASDKDAKFLLLRDFQVKYAQELFANGETDQAVNLFISFMAPPQVVIDLLPDIVTGEQPVDLHLIEEPQSPVESLQSPPSSPMKQNGRTKHRSKLSRLVISLIPYLTDTRRKLNKLLNPDSPKFDWRGVSIGKDIYLLSESGENNDLSGLIELVDTVLFKSYLISSPRLVGPLLRVHNYCNTEVVEKNLRLNHMFKELIDFYFAKELHEKALSLLLELGTGDSLLSGVSPTLQYLQKLNNNHIQVIFKYLKWPISIDKNHVKDVFLNDSIESESLNKFKVLAYLETEIGDVKLVEEYLQHLISELGDETTRFHNKLIQIYIDNKEIENLQSLLTESSSYDFDKVLSLLNDTDGKEYLIAKSIVHSKLHNHDQVMDIFVDELQDYDRALSYCLAIYEESSLKGERLMISLLSKYFASEKTTQEALNLLSTQSVKLDLEELLQTIPDSVSISKLYQCLVLGLQKIEVRLIKSNFIQNLEQLQRSKLKEQKLKLHKNHVIIDESSICSICQKRLGFSVINWLPDNSVVHYGCFQRGA